MADHIRIEHESLAIMVTKQMTTKIEIQGPLPDVFNFLRLMWPDHTMVSLSLPLSLSLSLPLSLSALQGTGRRENLGTRLQNLQARNEHVIVRKIFYLPYASVTTSNWYWKVGSFSHNVFKPFSFKNQAQLSSCLWRTRWKRI